jgi:transaldolase/glucose-6-phosphate isomerase
MKGTKMQNNIAILTGLGQSLWYDNIDRRLLNNGELERMITNGEIRGLTSNPSIFNHSISKSHDYDQALTTMAWAGYASQAIFEQVALEDIRAAADLLRPIYDESDGGDGFVSLEVSPKLAHDTDGTLGEARRLWQEVGRPNLMIKIPATRDGIPAIQQAIDEGININITLIFSLTRYLEVMKAYLSGLESRHSRGEAIQSIASVASFFVSRIDTKVDKQLELIIREESPVAAQAQELLGKIAIANARLAYQEFQKLFGSRRFKKLEKQGARVQRPLWASTSTKNPAYPDTLYVDSLIGPHTVNTVPQNTLEAFIDHGDPRETITNDVEQARQAMESLSAVGISMDAVTQELEDEGVKAFADAYEALLRTIEERRRQAVQQLGGLAEIIPGQVKELEEQSAVQRIYAHDPTFWTKTKKDQAEIKKRLGWLDLPRNSQALLPELKAFCEEIGQTSYTHALLLGMGGSSLAPEVMSLMFGPEFKDRSGFGGLDLAILDSTEPSQVQAAVLRAPIENSLFIVSSKSGSTIEVNAFLDYFWEKAQNVVGSQAGEHFIAITDAGTPLDKLAAEYGFRRVFHADKEVGGRYSALSAFGLIPAALMGVDVKHLLERAAWMAAQCAPDVPPGRNPGLVLGAILGAAAVHGRDKLTMAADPSLAPIGSWLEQLIAESSGKKGSGIIPVDGETLEGPEAYGADRLFIHLRRGGVYDQAILNLRSTGNPGLTFEIQDDYDLGAEFFRWEMATAVACGVLKVNAFDQPNVQDSKKRTAAKIATFQKQGDFNESEPAWQYKGIRIYLSKTLGKDFLEDITNLPGVFSKFLNLGMPGNYVAINAYLPRNPGMEVLLARLQTTVRARTHLATTLGFGPRFLHSSGQLHKGGPNTGLFLVITANHQDDMEIPGEELSFANLIRGQSLGDFEALDARRRRVLRVHLPDHHAVHQVIEAIESE